MKTIPSLSVLLLIILIFATTGLAQTPPPPLPPTAAPGGIPGDIPVKEWQEFRHDAGNFAVMMPGKPLEVSQTIEGDIGKVPTKSFVAQSGEITFGIMYADYPIAFDVPEAVKASLDGMRDIMLSKQRGKLISEKEHVFKKYPGRELTVGMDAGMARVRMYLIQQRLYMLTVLLLDANDVKEIESKQVDRFLDSFRLIEEPKAAPVNMASMSRIKSAFGNLELPPDFRYRPVSWREVSSPDLGFTVWMPGEPFIQKIPFNPNDRRLDIQLWMARGEGAICQMLVQPFLSAPSDEAIQGALFKSLLNGILESSGMKLELEKTVSFEGYPGREYRMRGDVGMGMGRAYIIGSNVYFMFGIVVNNKEGSEEVSRFFDSFRLTKKPDPAPATGAVSAGSATWREFSDPEHGFKVLLPGEPRKESSYSRGILTYDLLAGGDGITYQIMRQGSHTELGPELKNEAFYKAYIGAFAESVGLEITGESNIVVDGHEWREYKLKQGEVAGVARLFLDVRDIYLIVALKVLPGADQKSVLKFLDSFKLIEKSPKDEFAEPPPPPPAPALAPRPVRKDAIQVSGGVLQGSAIKKVEPVYPPIARAANAQGEVRIHVTISENGKVIEAEVIEGHPLLRDAALQAARQWEFTPTEFSGKPVKVVGILTFNFLLK